MSHKYKNRGLLGYLTTNHFEEFPAYTVLKFLKRHKIVIVTKNEIIDPQSSRAIFRIRRGRTKGFVNLSVSEDNLIRGKVVFNQKTKKIITRSMDEFLTLIKEIILGIEDDRN